MNKVVISLAFLLFCAGGVFASSVSVWQGQYYTGTTFNTDTYSFNFTVYDAETGGAACFTNTTSLTTGNWGQWRTEQSPWDSCNNASKDYFLNINIAGADQVPRRRLTVSDFLRRDVSSVQDGNLIVNDNVTADYYFGDGRFLVGVNGSGDINSVQGDEIYLYNGSDSGNVVLVFNESRLNGTIDSRASGLGDNSSWNESYADTLYLNLSGGNANQDINISPYNLRMANLTLAQRMIFSLGGAVDNIISGWVRVTGGLNVTGNAIINEGLNVTNDSYFFEDVYVAGKLRGFSPVEVEGGLNVSGDSIFYNDINFTGMIYGNGSQLTDIEADTLSDSVVTTSKIADNNVTDSKIANLSWTKLLDVPAGLGDGDNDTTYSHLSNFTDDILWTASFNTTGDSRWSGGVDSQKNASGPYLYNDSTTIYFNETYLNGTIDDRASGLGDNSSWNESYADTLYYAITNPFGFYNSSDFSIADYFTSAQILGFGYYNSSDFNIGDYYLKSNPSSYWNDTYATFNKTYADGLYLQNGTSAWFLEINSTGNITTEEIHFEKDVDNHRIYDNSTCVIIQGDTSTMYIC